ncbi:MAG: hypothetical protein RML56_12495 [Burkholderiales bacterium]|nr:hypothetical protein [Burkholderiales bacterium]
MDLPLPVLLAVLGAAAAHAAWNALLKSGTDPLLDAALLALAASALAAPALALVEPPGPQVWPNLLASASIRRRLLRDALFRLSRGRSRAGVPDHARYRAAFRRALFRGGVRRDALAGRLERHRAHLRRRALARALRRRRATGAQAPGRSPTPRSSRPTRSSTAPAFARPAAQNATSSGSFS